MIRLLTVSQLTKTPRKKITENQNILLVSQVHGICPRCTRELLYEKVHQAQKGYEVAHIYPLNPTQEETELLQGEERLSEDVNDLANLIPLCNICHRKFDRPRTVEEYRELVAIKRKVSREAMGRGYWATYHLQDELARVVTALSTSARESDASPTLVLDPKEIDRKVDESMSALTLRRIHHDVQDYYYFIQAQLAHLDVEAPGTADLIAQQVRTFYFRQKAAQPSQEEIYSAISDWIQAKVENCSGQSAEVLTSFFVQNCEVFE